MAEQIVAPVSLAADMIANAFVGQYYNILHRSPEMLHRFYQDSSTISRPNIDGFMSSMSTIQAINEKVLSLGYKDSKFEIETVDAQHSYKDGVTVLVTGCLVGKEDTRWTFTQSFFLAPQDSGGYFVLNDVFRYVGESQPHNHLLDNSSHDSAPKASASPNPSSIQGMSEALENAEDVSNQSKNRGPIVEEENPPVQPSQEEATAVVEEEIVGPSTQTNQKEAPTIVGKEIVDPQTQPSEEEVPTVIEEEEARTVVEEIVDPPGQSGQEDVPTVVGEEIVDPPVQPSQEESPTTLEVTTEIVQEDAPKSYASIVKVTKVTAKPSFYVHTVKPKVTPAKVGKRAVAITSDLAPEAASPSTDDIPGNSDSQEVKEKSIYIRNLPFNVTPAQIEGEFKKFGPIKPRGVQVRNHKQHGYCFGFVEFESASSMQSAIEAASVMIANRQVVVEKRNITRVSTAGNTSGSTGGRGRFPLGGGGFRNGNISPDDTFRGPGGFDAGQSYGRNESRTQREFSGRGRWLSNRGREGHQNGTGSFHPDGLSQNDVPA